MTVAESAARLNQRALRAEAQLAVATPVARTLLVGSVLMAVAFCSANLWVTKNLNTDDAVQLGLHAATVPVLVFALLAGAYSASSDRRFGYVEQRLFSNQRRLVWLVSKVFVQAAVGVGYGVFGVLSATITSAVVFSAKGASYDMTSPLAVKALVGVMIAAPLFSAIGVCVGAMSANTPMVVTGILVWSLVIEPPVTLGLPSVGRWLPTAGGLALTNSPNPDLVSQVTGGMALLVYAVAGVGISAWRLQRTDL